MKNKLYVVLLVWMLPASLFIFPIIILILPTIYDRSLNREKMYYDLGDGKTVTVMLQDSLAYVMPYRYEGKKPPTEDYIYFKRHYTTDQYIFLYFNSDNEILLGPNWNIENINLNNYKYIVLGKYKPIPFSKKSNPETYQTSEHISAIIDSEQKILDSLSLTRSLFIVSDGKPVIVQLTRVHNKKITSHMFRGHKEDKVMFKIIKE